MRDGSVLWSVNRKHVNKVSTSHLQTVHACNVRYTQTLIEINKHTDTGTSNHSTYIYWTLLLLYEFRNVYSGSADGLIYTCLIYIEDEIIRNDTQTHLCARLWIRCYTSHTCHIVEESVYLPLFRIQASEKEVKCSYNMFYRSYGQISHHRSI